MNLKSMTRRQFIAGTGRFAAAMCFASPEIYSEFLGSSIQEGLSGSGYGPLNADPEKIMDLPDGFRYRIISRSGERMTDGYYVPSHPDGMGAFQGPEGTVIVLRNHEVRRELPSSSGPFGDDNRLLRRTRRNLVYDVGTGNDPALGGVTTLVFDPAQEILVRQYLSLAGTLVNCSGGVTPWNSWLSCEEVFQNPNPRFAQRHGYVFEVPVSAEPKLVRPIPLRDMGRFVHEAAAVDVRTNIIYMTEDQVDSLIYRFIPEQPGRLSEGGRLQCLQINSRPQLDTRNWGGQTVRPGEKMAVDWVDLERVDGRKDDLRIRGFERGAALFGSGEGMVFSDGVLYFDCTNGGPTAAGQVWTYVPSPFEGTEKERESPGQLGLFIEAPDTSVMDHPDQMTFTPWGDLFLCEDGTPEHYLLGVTPEREIYRFARNTLDDSEFTGVCFAPDGRTMFVNYQKAGLTFAVAGPWKTNPSPLGR